MIGQQKQVEKPPTPGKKGKGGKKSLKRSAEDANAEDSAAVDEVAPVADSELDQSPSKKVRIDDTDDAKKDSAETMAVVPTNPNTLHKFKSPEVAALLLLEQETMSPDWFNALKGEMEKEYFLNIKRKLEAEKKAKVLVFPPEPEIYSFTQCLLKDIRVVILGQDPYHDNGQAHGLCFSVKKGVKIPPSLVNIYKEIKNSYPDFKIPTHGNLEGWVKQGVLLLNASLTVRAHSANSHSQWGWSTFTDAIIKHVNSLRPTPDNGKPITLGQKPLGIVFMLWGGNARKKKSMIDKNRHLILECAHPSPLSAHQGFFGCGHFKKVNEYLKERGGREIDWGAL
ncbi:hypothetical protein HDU76_000073 [Blyttiomyces sp. JEL0837]|nr:hypothetical protein HDU76_000073 [Blyttiomyces sp. JEL0837]